MKAVKILATALCLAAITAVSIDEASARGRHGPRVSIGIGVGAGFWGGGYYGGYYPWGGYVSPWWTVPVVPPVVVTQPQAAPTYIQQTPAASAPVSAPAASDVWYYCRDPAGYYPYVSECKGNWLRVLPQ
ncbi:MAG: hypothetical protein LBV49_13310 [Azonexus sp.]|jgi:hypothetical protein|nr:hypothetical protein [Azonexus sp.]